jgi:CHASE3 domain sensor protein
MSDERELRAALEAAQGKLKSAEAEAAKARARSDELEALRLHQAEEIKSLEEVLSRRQPQENEGQALVIQSLRAQLDAAQREVADLRHTEKKRLAQTPSPLAKLTDDGGGYALLGLVMIIVGIWFTAQGTDGALCLIGMGVAFAAPWTLLKLS